MADDNRGFASMPKDKVREIAQKGGEASPTKFEQGDSRAQEAGKKGGEARAQDQDVKSGELGRQGTQSRFGKDE